MTRSTRSICLTTVAALMAWTNGFHCDSWAADSRAEKERSIKAAVVLKIAKFVSWPDHTPSANQFTVCLYQNPILNEESHQFNLEKLWPNSVITKEINTWPEADNCNLLLVEANKLLAFKLDVKHGPHKPVLVIADLTQGPSKGKAHTGVHVALVRQGTRIAFEVHLSELGKSGLKISSEFLKLARIVRGDE